MTTRQHRNTLRISLSWFVLATTLFGCPAFAAAASQNASFAGKTLRIVSNTAPGSAVDTFVRKIAPYIEKSLPGKPTLIVENKPGGRFTLGASYMEKNVSPDGMTMGVLATIVGQWAVNPHMPFDLFGYTMVGAQGESTVVYARKDGGVLSADDFGAPNKPIIMSVAAPNTMPVLPVPLFLNAMGLHSAYRVIPGYQGQTGMYQAARTGESNMSFMFSDLWMERLPTIEKENRLVGLMEYGQLRPDNTIMATPGLGLPIMDAVWRKLAPRTLESDEYKAFHAILATGPLEWLYVLPPKTPVAYTEVWERAVKAALADPAYRRSLKESGAPLPAWVGANDATGLLAQVKARFSDPAVRAALKSAIDGK
jgi:putative tricarboxylic transport membrane protein